MKHLIEAGKLAGTKQTEEKSLNKVNTDLKDDLKLLDNHHSINFNINRTANYDKAFDKKYGKGGKDLCHTI